MSTQTNERAFETQVEETLLGAAGWQRGSIAEWDVERALFPARVCQFLEATQAKLWADMRALHGAGLEKLIVAADRARSAGHIRRPAELARLAALGALAGGDFG